MIFEMEHPMIMGIITVKTRANKKGTMFYTATTESGVLLRQMTFAKDEIELGNQVYYHISKLLS